MSDLRHELYLRRKAEAIVANLLFERPELEPRKKELEEQVLKSLKEDTLLGR